jgi:hypothetical protein
MPRGHVIRSSRSRVSHRAVSSWNTDPGAYSNLCMRGSVIYEMV